MNGILGMAQLLQTPGLTDDERQRYVQIILDSGQALLTLLNDILDLSKIEAGKLELVTQDFRADQMLDDIATLYGESARSKGLVLEARWLGPSAQTYRSDALRLRQALANLVSNAIKFTASGSVRIEAGEISREAGAAMLRFAVSDTGIGIAPEDIGELFQPFTQVDSGHTRRFGGTGLGLSIVRRLAEMMGGSIEVSSTPSHGSTFGFTACVAIENNGHAALSTVITNTPDAGGNGQSVLVVDDNNTNRLLLEACLCKHGYVVTTATDGRMALDMLTSGRVKPALVLMDCLMPEMDGYAATRALRDWEKSQEQPPLPVIAISAGAFEEDRQRCREAGMDDFIAKPIDFQVLLTTVQRHL